MSVMWFVTLMDHVENTTSRWLKQDCSPQQFEQNHGFVFGFLIVWAEKPGFGRCYWLLSGPSKYCTQTVRNNGGPLEGWDNINNANILLDCQWYTTCLSKISSQAKNSLTFSSYHDTLISNCTQFLITLATYKHVVFAKC